MRWNFNAKVLVCCANPQSQIATMDKVRTKQRRRRHLTCKIGQLLAQNSFWKHLAGGWQRHGLARLLSYDILALQV